MAGNARSRTFVVMGLVMMAILFTTLWMAAQRLKKQTVADVVRQYGPAVDPIWQQRFEAAGLPGRPDKLILAVFKREKALEVWAENAAGDTAFLAAYPVLAASGGPGPKLRAGDRQVPEGVYGVESLNPNSRFHLSIKIDYPNADDVRVATEESRDNLGGDVFIHGSNVSTGNVAIGNEAIREVFVLVAETDLANISVLLFPNDMRVESPPIDEAMPDWLLQRYNRLWEESDRLQR